jgi:hypothetical protein
LEDKSFALILRGGGYNEPTRFAEGRSRSHVTYGAEVRLGPVVVSYGADTAEQFSNSAFSAGVSLGDI